MLTWNARRFLLSSITFCILHSAPRHEYWSHKVLSHYKPQTASKLRGLQDLMSLSRSRWGGLTCLGSGELQVVMAAVCVWGTVAAMCSRVEQSGQGEIQDGKKTSNSHLQRKRRWNGLLFTRHTFSFSAEIWIFFFSRRYFSMLLLTRSCVTFTWKCCFDGVPGLVRLSHSISFILKSCFRNSWIPFSFSSWERNVCGS